MWDVKEVSDGYARNFLISKKIAQIASDSALAEIEAKKNKQNQIERENREMTQQIAKSLEKKEIVITSKEKDGKLFGSITAKDIIKALAKENIHIAEKSVVVDSPIRELGDFRVKIKLDHGIETEVIIKVSKE